MYNFEGFGKRISSLRRRKGLTQEYIAARLNITSQAVSKWENETSYPDITLLPHIAGILGVSIEMLFGADDVAYNLDFPETYENLPFVHSYQDAAVYSKKIISYINDTRVDFSDGSSADFISRVILNKGAGEIRFVFSEQLPRKKSSTKTESEFTFSDNVNSLEIKAVRGDYDITVSGSNDQITSVRADGSPEHIENFTAVLQNGRLICEESRQQSNGGSIDIKICLAAGRCENLLFNINGSSDIKCAVPSDNVLFKINGSGEITQFAACMEAEVNINGSGDVSLEECIKKLTADINGSGDIICKKGGGVIKAGINGSGDIVVEEVSGSFKADINGSGDIKLGSGTVESFDAVIRGSGMISAKDVTTGNANLHVEHSGEIILGRVIYESTEKHGKKAKITILKRGPE